MTLRGCVNPPATLTDFQPGAVFMGKWRLETPAHEVGTPVCTGPGVEVGRTVVLRVVGFEEVGVGPTLVALLDWMGLSGTRFASTSLSKFSFCPSERSRYQCPNFEWTLKVDRLFAG